MIFSVVMQTSPSQLLMPGRDDKLPHRPRVGQATVAKTSASSRSSREQRTMVDAVTFVCALSRKEPNEHLLLSSVRKRKVWLGLLSLWLCMPSLSCARECASCAQPADACARRNGDQASAHCRVNGLLLTFKRT